MCCATTAANPGLTGMEEIRTISQRFALLPPRLWLEQIFAARSARQGGIVRRKVQNPER